MNIYNMIPGNKYKIDEGQGFRYVAECIGEVKRNDQTKMRVKVLDHPLAPNLNGSTLDLYCEHGLIYLGRIDASPYVERTGTI